MRQSDQPALLTSISHHHRLAGLLLVLLAVSAQAEDKREPVDFVNPRIGALGHLLTGTAPSVLLPYGMVRCVPATTAGPDAYLAGKISGFPGAGVVLMPVTGPLETKVAAYASEFDRDFETVTPYYGSDVLDKYGIIVEYTAAQRALFYRITYPASKAGRLLLFAGPGGEISTNGSNVVSGYSGNNSAHNYFYAIFSQPFIAAENINSEANGGRRGESIVSGSALVVDFAAQAEGTVGVRIGASNISVEQARSNLLADLPTASFAAAKSSAKATWNRELGRIAIEGGTERERTIFYTGLYRALSRPNNQTEANGDYYSGMDRQVH